MSGLLLHTLLGASTGCCWGNQVLIRDIHLALQQEAAVILAAPVALLAQGYRTVFGPALECNFNFNFNFALNNFGMMVVDEASLVSPESFSLI